MSGEIVNLVGLDIPHDAQQARKIAKIAVVQGHLVGDPQPAQAMVLDAAMRRTTNDAMNLIAFSKQQLRQISPVLSGNSGHKRAFRHRSPMAFQLKERYIAKIRTT